MSTAAHNCPLCGGSELSPILTRSKSAVLQNRTFTTETAARAAAAGRLEIRQCEDCGFIHNAAFDPTIVEYAPEYENEQGNSARFRAHISDLIERIRQAADDTSNLSIVDIGCGQGSFLEAAVGNMQDRKAQGYGFDTAYRGTTAPSQKLRFFRDYFDIKTSAQYPDGALILITRHVIEHVPDPVRFLSGIRAAIRPDQPARLFIETPCTEWIFRHRAVHDFFYEHCNYWTADSLVHAAGRAGFKPVQVDHVFDGQYLWLEAIPADTAMPPAEPVNRSALAAEYIAHESETLASWHAYLARAAAEGPIALWGAGAKGVTMANLLDSECRLIDCLIDINPRKQGRYIPITAHLVTDARSAYRRGVHAAFVMNPNYAAEIRDMLSAEQIDIRVIDETKVTS